VSNPDFFGFRKYVCLLSGLAVVPNPNEEGSSNATRRDMVFGLAQEASAPGSSGDGRSEEEIRRTIIMVRVELTLENCQE
jgi:hypothetical protein